jgi:arylsulfatase
VAFDDDAWELYHVAEDASECNDLAATHPERLAAMVERWWAEAEAHQVLPLDNRPFSAFVLERPPAVPARERYVYYPGSSPVPEMVAVNIRNRHHQVTADIDVPEADGAPQGVLVAQGSGLGGWALYVADGRPAYVHNYVGLEEHHVVADPATPVLGPGPHEVVFRFTRTADHQGVGRLSVDGAVVGEGPVPRGTPMRFSITGAGLTCGYSDGLPVSRRYGAPFAFTGHIRRVVVDVDGQPFSDAEADAHFSLARQ